LPDVLPRVQFPTGGGSVAWNPDETAVVYTRYPAPGERPEEDLRFHQQVYRHVLGTDPARDTYEVGREFPRLAEIELSTTPDAGFTLARVAHGDGGDHSYYWKVEGGPWQQFADPGDKIDEAVLGDDGMVYVLSKANAPRGRVLRLPLDHPDPDSGLELAAANDGVLRHLAVHDGRLYVSELVGGPSRLHQYATSGASSRAVVLPEACSVAALVPRRDGTLLVRLHRYTEPPSWHVFNPTRSTMRRSALVVTAPVTFADVTVERLAAPAQDGTEIPITLLVPRRAPAGKPAPLLLVAYGSYGAVNEPWFESSRRLWFDAGGVIAIAHVRGGGDFGEGWHEAARLTTKQTTFSDFERCVRYLIAKQRTTPDQLAIQGASAGGLLTGVALTQTPELYRAVVSRVGIHDSLRVELTPNGEFNTTEFGTVKVRAQFEALLGYSPYHHVAARADYPAVLLATGRHDGRVAPWHSYKMAARLQAATTSRHPILLRVDPDSGHGLGSARAARLAEKADIWAFLLAELGLSRPEES
jgi:prolyl oligopeptidase